MIEQSRGSFRFRVPVKEMTDVLLEDEDIAAEEEAGEEQGDDANV